MPGLSHRPGRYALYGPYYRPAACWEIMREGLWAEVAKRHASVLSAMGAIYLSRTGRRGRRGGRQTGRAGVLVRNHLLSAASEARRVPRETQSGGRRQGDGAVRMDACVRWVYGWQPGSGDYSGVIGRGLGEIPRAAPAARKAARSSKPSKLGATTSMTCVN
jgi:hypothetical protein